MDITVEEKLTFAEQYCREVIQRVELYLKYVGGIETSDQDRKYPHINVFKNDKKVVYGNKSIGIIEPLLHDLRNIDVLKELDKFVISNKDKIDERLAEARKKIMSELNELDSIDTQAWGY